MGDPGRKLKKILFILGITGAVYLGIRYLLPLVVPFLCAYGMALWMRPSVRWLEGKCEKLCERRRRDNKKSIQVMRVSDKKKGSSLVVWLGAAELLILLTMIGVLGYFGGRGLLNQTERFMAALPQLISQLDLWLTGICRSLEQTFGLKNDYLVAAARELVRELGSAVRQASMPTLMTNSMTILRFLAEGIVFLIIFVIATLMFLKEMEEIRERKSKSMFHREFALIGRRFVEAGSAWLKTEMVVLSITACLCVLGLLLIGNEYAFLLGIGIGVLDALPLFGAGVVLIPWGIWMLAQRRWFSGIVLLGVYAICYLTRQVLEAKIMGQKIGLSPLETLVSMYVGLKLFGLVGFLLGPLGLLVIEDLVEFYWSEGVW